MFTVEVLGASSLAPRKILTARPLLVGRAPECDIVLSDPSISRHHANLLVDGTQPRVQDLDSRNGTFVDGERVVGQADVAPGQVIRLGTRDALRIQRAPVTLRPAPPMIALDNVATGLRVLLGAEPLRVGAGAHCTIRLSDGPDELAVLARRGPDEVWLGIDDDMEEVPLDQPFELAGERYVLRVLPSTPHATLADEATGNDYLLEATLDGPTGAVASVRSKARGIAVEITAENRATLLYVLAKRWRDDADGDCHHDERGWLDDETVATSVWGRAGAARPLKVLVCRVRQDLREAGLDPWCIEKRRGQIRAAVAGARIT